MSDSRVLLREFLRAPTRVATVTASSDSLVAALLAPHALDGATAVVELGAGTGHVDRRDPHIKADVAAETYCADRSRSVCRRDPYIRVGAAAVRCCSDRSRVFSAQLMSRSY